MSWFAGRHKARAAVLHSSQLRFGRYSDAYKRAAQLRAWERAIRYYAEGSWFKSFQHVLYYLHDPMEQNVHWVADREGNIHFELFQGSRRISGVLGHPECQVFTALGQATSLTEELMVHLLQTNYRLRYCAYGLDGEGRIVLRFSSPANQSDPIKLHAALKELAMEADDTDDVLVREHPGLEMLVEPHVRNKSADDIAWRVAWCRAEVGSLIRSFEEERARHEAYPGGFCYQILASVYRWEFLLAPQGMMRQIIRSIHRDYAHKRVSDPRSCMPQWMARLERIYALPEEELAQEFYDVTTTFGDVEPLSAKRLRRMLEGQVREMDTWLQAGLAAYARPMPAFIMGYILYRYALPGFLRDVFALYFLAMDPVWADGLGLGWHRDGLVKAQRQVRQSLRHLAEDWSDRWQVSGLDPEVLDFSRPEALGRSWLMMLIPVQLEAR